MTSSEQNTVVLRASDGQMAMKLNEESPHKLMNLRMMSTKGSGTHENSHPTHGVQLGRCPLVSLHQTNSSQPLIGFPQKDSSKVWMETSIPAVSLRLQNQSMSETKYEAETESYHFLGTDVGQQALHEKAEKASEAAQV